MINPGPFNRVGLERAGGHKFKFSYGTIGEAMEQLTVENKERKRRGLVMLRSPVGLWGLLISLFCFCFGGGKGHLQQLQTPLPYHHDRSRPCDSS